MLEDGGGGVVVVQDRRGYVDVKYGVPRVPEEGWGRNNAGACNLRLLCCIFSTS